MTTKERIHAEIDQADEERLDELYDVIRRFLTSRVPKRGFLAKLAEVKIDAPSDFAANLDLYLSGERRVENDLH